MQNSSYTNGSPGYGYQSNGYGGNAPAAPSAVSSKRMTYGSISASSRETRDRQELFAGAEQRLQYQHQQQQQQQQAPQEELSNDELMQQAVTQHKDTTATAKRALQVLEQTKEIQGNTQAALSDQREQMNRIEDDLDKIGQDLTYSERILRFMKLCCCVGFFCSCCTEPGRSGADKKWRGSTSGPTYDPGQAPYSQSMQQQQQQQQRGKQRQQQGAPGGSSAYPGVHTRGLEEVGYGQQAAVIDAETQQQDKYLDEISKGLDQLKFGAQRMNEELRYQESHADRIRRDADTLEYKLHNVNREGFRRI